MSCSRRKQLFELVKTTKDVYMPTISSTISQLASEATTRALNVASEFDQPSSSGKNNNSNNNNNYSDANIVIYPHFTRRVSDPADASSGNGYKTQAHGWVYSITGPSRKKRLILSLARQLVKSNAVPDSVAGELQQQIESVQDSESDASSLMSSSASTASVSTSTSTSNESTRYDQILQERMAAFLNRSLGNLELTIALGGKDDDQLKIVNTYTDSNGNFNVDISTDFKPTFIQVAISQDEKQFEVSPIESVGSSKYAIITDIDDTIKNTGICGEKRSIFRNIFVDDISTWEIPGVADWLRYLNQNFDASVFYVSNSPYQLFTNLSIFFSQFEFPKGSIYLKRYNGNILNSLMEPSSNRKKIPLRTILSQFPDKKFFLIGDTSEQDLEAYVDLAKEFPHRIMGIYLRVAPNSMNINTYKTLLDILNKRNELNDNEDNTFLRSTGGELIKLDQTDSVANQEYVIRQDYEFLRDTTNLKPDEIAKDLIEFSDSECDETDKASKSATRSHPPPPPPPPPKPLHLKSTKLKHSPPPLPTRPTSARPLTSKSFDSSFQNVPFTEETNDEWISRILTSLIILRKVGNIKLQLYNDIDEISNDVLKILKSKDKSTNTTS